MEEKEMKWMKTTRGVGAWCVWCSDDPFSLQSEDESDKEKDAEALKELVKEDSEEDADGSDSPISFLVKL